MRKLKDDADLMCAETVRNEYEPHEMRWRKNDVEYAGTQCRR